MKKYLIFTSIFALITSSLHAAKWDDPDVQLAQRISDRGYIDGRNGQIVSTRGMAEANPFPTANTTNNTASTVSTAMQTAQSLTPASNPSSTPTGNGTPPTNNTGAGTPTNANGTAQPKPTVASNWKNMTAMGKMGVVAGGVGGATMIVSNTAGTSEHSVGNVVGGVAGGASLGMAVGSVIPAVGTVVGGIVGAVVGGVISGSQLFSETDCMHDAVTGKFTCCNTAFNKGERQVDIGGYMFCSEGEKGKDLKYIAPGVRQCLQGGQAEKSDWWDGLWKDDAWAPECVERLCDGYVEPDEAGRPWARYVPNKEKICYDWTCIEGYTRQGNTCISNNPTPVTTPDQTAPASPTTPTVDPAVDALNKQYDAIIQAVQAEYNRLNANCSGV